MEDAMDMGSLEMVNAQIQQAIFATTGMLTQEGGGSAPMEGEDGPLPGAFVDPAIEASVLDKLIQRAYGARFAQRRIPSGDV